MNIIIRPAGKTDIEIILDFMADYYRIEEVNYEPDNSRITLEDFINNSQSGSLFIIQSSNDVIGYFCIAFSYTLQYYGKDCFLDEIYIKPEFRHKGIGSHVMNFIEDYLKQNNFKAMHLIVYDHNKPAFEYYIKNGFKAHDAKFMTKIFSN